MSVKEETCIITPPKFGVTDFFIEGTAPLVVTVWDGGGGFMRVREA